MGRAVFGEPLRAHRPEIGLVGAPGNARPIDHQRDTDCDENHDGQQHGLGPAGTRAVIAAIVPDPATCVCAVVHTCTGFEGASVVAVAKGLLVRWMMMSPAPPADGPDTKAPHPELQAEKSKNSWPDPYRVWPFAFADVAGDGSMLPDVDVYKQGLDRVSARVLPTAAAATCLRRCGFAGRTVGAIATSSRYPPLRHGELGGSHAHSK